MKLTSLIFAVAGLFSLLLPAHASDNYSLWPRRPDELEQVRRLMAENKGGEAVLLLQPFVADEGVAGREARLICGRVNIPRYLSRMHPGATVYTVKRGDNIARIAARQKCPQDVIMMLNGIVQPSALRVGQKLVVIPMRLRVEIRPHLQEVSVWDDQQLVAAYPILSMDSVPQSRQKSATCSVSAREGYLGAQVVPQKSPQYASSNRAVILSNGMSLVATYGGLGTIRFRMNQKDLNELAMLVNRGNEVRIIYPNS